MKDATSAPTAISGPLTPPNGKTLFFIGQDVDSIETYMALNGSQASGFTEYTSLPRLEGITAATNYGSGPHHLDYLAETYPNQQIALGLYLVNFLPAISEGRADKAIDRLLDHLEGYNRPVFLRFGYEFDGEWNYYEPEQFVSAWIHFHNKLNARNITNVAMVWQSAAYCNGTYKGQPISAWYPGDKYVDWVALSYFTQVDCNFKPIQKMIDFAREHQKPLLIAESTPQRYDLTNLTFSRDGKTFANRTPEAIWDEWFAPYFQLIYDNSDVIRGVAYINANWDEQPMWGPPYSSGYWGDARVQANEEILRRWQVEMEKEIWQGNE